MVKKKRKRNKKCHPTRWIKQSWYITVYENKKTYMVIATTPNTAMREFYRCVELGLNVLSVSNDEDGINMRKVIKLSKKE